MKKDSKINQLVLFPALILGSVFKESGFTKEHIEFYFEFDVYFIKHLKAKKGTIKKLLQYHKDLKETIIKHF